MLIATSARGDMGMALQKDYRVTSLARIDMSYGSQRSMKITPQPSLTRDGAL
jgi:hypothetical protein